MNTEDAGTSRQLDPPHTGNHEIDRACASLDLGDDVSDHPAALEAVLDAVQRTLTAGPSLPDALRPR